MAAKKRMPTNGASKGHARAGIDGEDRRPTGRKLKRENAAALSDAMRPQVLMSKLMTLLRERRESNERHRLTHLVLEALAVARERDPKGLREIEKACRKVLDGAWASEKIVDVETGQSWLSAHPLELRPAEAHLAVNAVITAAAVAMGKASMRNDDRAGARAVDEVVTMLQRYPTVFPGKGDAAAVGRVAGALLDSFDREKVPLRAVLRAWGVDERRVKHAEQSVRRQKK